MVGVEQERLVNLRDGVVVNEKNAPLIQTGAWVWLGLVMRRVDVDLGSSVRSGECDSPIASYRAVESVRIVVVVVPNHRAREGSRRQTPPRSFATTRLRTLCLFQASVVDGSR